MLTEDAERGARDRARAGRDQHRAPVGRDGDRLRGRAPADRRATPSARPSRALVLACEGWHPGVIGIVASRLVERYHRPCVLIALDGEGSGRGSGRSIAPFDLHAGLAACAEHLVAVRRPPHGGRASRSRRTGSSRSGAALVEHAPARSTRRTSSPRARRRGRGRRRARARAGRGARAPAAVRDGQPRREPARPGRAGLGRAADGRGPPRALHGRLGRRPLPRGRVRRRRPRGTVPARGRRRATTSSRAWSRTGGEGSVEPRLVVRSLHDARWGRGPHAADVRHVRCRRDEAAWWDAVWDASTTAEPCPPSCAAGAERAIVDRRGEGALGVLGDLLTTGEPLLVVCADVSRRARAARARPGPGAVRPRPWVRVSARCGPEAAERARDAGDASVLSEYACARRRPVAGASLPARVLARPSGGPRDSRGAASRRR